MKIVDNKSISIKIVKKPKCEKFRWKSHWESMNYNYFKVKNGKDFKYINTWSYYMPEVNRCFWLWWIVVIKIKPKLISGETPNRYVRFEDTHLELMDLPKGNWDD